MLSSFPTLLLLTPGSRIDDLQALFPVINELVERNPEARVKWFVSWEHPLPMELCILRSCYRFALTFLSNPVLPDPFPAVYRISQARERLRSEALNWDSEVVLWLDDDMQPKAEQLEHLVRLAQRHRVVIGPKMHSRHATDDRICAWRFTTPHKYSFMLSSVEPDYRYQGVDGLGLACTAHVAEALNDFSFCNYGSADDYHACCCLRSAGWGMVVDYETHVLHKGAPLDER